MASSILVNIVQEIACHLPGAKPSPEPVFELLTIGIFGMNWWEISIEVQIFSSNKMHLKIQMETN